MARAARNRSSAWPSNGSRQASRSVCQVSESGVTRRLKPGRPTVLAEPGLNTGPVRRAACEGRSGQLGEPERGLALGLLRVAGSVHEVADRPLLGVGEIGR